MRLLPLLLIGSLLEGPVEAQVRDSVPQAPQPQVQKVYATPTGVPRTIKAVSLPPLRVGGWTSGALQVQVFDAANTRVAHSAVSITAMSPGVRFSDPDRITDDQGVARFNNLYVVGRPGRVRVRFTAGDAVLDDTLDLREGDPVRALVLADLPPGVLSDSSVAETLIVVVEDAGENRLDRVRVSLHPVPIDRADALARESYVGCAGLPSVPHGRLLGPVEGLTDDTGTVTFPGLRYSGPGAEFRVAICANDQVVGWTGASAYDPGAVYDRSYVVISAIKTLSGNAPPNEFFDVRIRLRLGPAVTVSGNFDLSLSRKESTDTTAGATQVPTDGTAQFHYHFRRPYSEGVGEVPQRIPSVGMLTKVLNGVPYWGVHATLTELGGSPFHGSSVSFGWVNRMVDAPQIIEGDTIRPATDNLFYDFFIRSTRIEFFRYLTVRGSFFLPLSGPDRRMQSRIAVAVPIGDVNSF